VSFAHAELLWLLLLPAALLLWELARRARAAAAMHPRILAAEAGPTSLRLREDAGNASEEEPHALAAPNRKGRRKRGSKPLLWCGLALGLVALARPQYGEREVPVFEQSREVLIALDLSRSMLAEDIRPSRLTRAKLLISGLFERLAGERVGLIVFSGTAFLQSPLSSDYEILREFLPALGPDTLPEGGTNYRALLDTALDGFSNTPATDRFLIVLSDGEATEDTWNQRLPELKKRNIRTIALGIGSPTGAMIPDGTGGLIKDERGAVVLSRLEPATLRALADATGGLYRDASTWLDLAALIAETVERGAQGEFTDTHTQRLIDRYQWALAPALALLLLSFWLEFPIRPRPRTIALRGTAPNAKTRTAPPLTALLLLLATVLPNPAHAQAEPPPRPEPSALGKIVSRLADKKTPPSGRDWAELARETVTWGRQLQTAQHPVPPGPVHDALRAAEIGEALDPQTADWAELRRELESLLAEESPSPPEDPQDQEAPKPPPPDGQNQPQGGEDGRDPKPTEGTDSQEGNSGAGDSQAQPQSGSEGQGDSPQDQNDAPQPQAPDNAPTPKSDALGDMQDAAPQPEPQQTETAEGHEHNDHAPQSSAPNNTQQVGGTQSQPPSEQTDDPALATSLQKLEQIRNEDSPAHLFQMLDDTPRDGAPPTKNW